MAHSNKSQLGWKGFINLHNSSEVNQMIEAEETSGEFYTLDSHLNRVSYLCSFGTMSISKTPQGTFNVILHIPADREHTLAGYKLSLWDNTQLVGVACLYLAFRFEVFQAMLKRMDDD